jgi:hypothetical protein
LNIYTHTIIYVKDGDRVLSESQMIVSTLEHYVAEVIPTTDRFESHYVSSWVCAGCHDRTFWASDNATEWKYLKHYIGQWRNNKKHGVGKLTEYHYFRRFVNRLYEGGSKNDAFHGQGYLIKVSVTGRW